MKKNNALVLTLGLSGLLAMYAFTAPEKARDQFLTIFFPERTPSLAKDFLPVSTDETVDAPDDSTRLKRALAHAEGDTLDPLEERYDDFINKKDNPFDLKDPKVIEQNVEYDPVTDQYIMTEKIGEDYYRAPTYMTFDEYNKWKEKKQQQAYFDKLQGVATGDGKKSGAGIGDPVAKFDIKTSLIDRLFGGTNVDIKPQGNINLTFGFDYQKIQNPILTLRQQRTGNFDFDMDINMGATGKIGEKLNLNFNYNTQATFDFDNQMKLNYDSKNFSEDEILQNIEAGNVSMPLRSTLIKGAQNLFGIKAETKWGHLRVTTIASQQRSKQQSINVQGGAQVQQFEVPIDEYDENRHFFISQFNREEFEPALKCLPVPQTLFRISRMEVWITNDNNKTENIRQIVALADLGEPNPANPDVQKMPGADKDVKGKYLPGNGANDLYPRIGSDLGSDSTFRFADKVVRRLKEEYNLKQITDFEKFGGRLLSPQEYSFHDQLGFVSINLNVQPDQALGVAIEYTYNGKPYKIGEFTSDFPNRDTLSQNVLFVKMLKATTANVKLPIWDLMMKNIYAIGTANLDPQEFRFDIKYDDPGKGQKRFLSGSNIPAGLNSKPLLQVFRLDTLNQQQDPGPDGVFDFVPGLTINLRSGRVMFPVLEPFGKYLQDKFIEADPSLDTPDEIKNLRNTIVYSELYDSTLFRAKEYQHLNRFTLFGSYKSASNAEISLGTFNLPQGSVRVSAGGRQLIEGQDYEVDYNIGKVKILNDAILQSGQNVSVSFEDNTLFGFQSRTMLGVRADYAFNKDVSIGATFMNLFERPLTQKVNFGDDPINNKVYGLDFNISKEAPWLTKLVDKIPLINTKEPSAITAQAEVALLDPGHARAINQGADKGGTIYLDDFEGSTSGIPLTTPANGWVLASVPTGDANLSMPEAEYSDSLASGVNRARLSWYIADPSAREGTDNENPYTRIIEYRNLFPNRDLSPLEQSFLRPLDVTIHPRERGPYNYELPEGYSNGISAGLTPEGLLKDPKSRWAGFMRGLNTTDFENANIEFVEFWVLNPFMEVSPDQDVSESGNMYIDLGSISEDVQRDSRQFFENAIPTSGSGAIAQSAWGRVPVQQPVVNAFDNDPAKRVQQDVGLDGLDDSSERLFFANYLNQIQSGNLNQEAKDSIASDPSNDNFVYFRDVSRFGQVGDGPGLLERYRKFNSPQGNSPVNNTDNLNPSATNQPDQEEINRDNTLNETESFFRYKIPMVKKPGENSLDLSNAVLKELVTDTVRYLGPNGQEFVWYRFKVPLDAKNNVRTTVGGIQDFRSIRFVRVFFREFTERTTFRFATFELGRNQWRRYTQALPNLRAKGCDVVAPNLNNVTSFDVNSVSIEENAARTPFNYTIPPDIRREQSVGAFPDVRQNEQALSVEVCNLFNCDGRAIFKTLNLDLRQFKRMKMFVHLEDKDLANPIQPGQLSAFIRIGSDYSRNYYEYEVPLTPSNAANLPPNADTREYKEEVWRPENNFDFPLELLTEVKKLRNAANIPAGEYYKINDPEKPGNIVALVGNPNLGLAKGIMIGIRNADSTSSSYCAEVWFNELRLNGFDEQGGYAGLARMDAKLADLGNISLAGNYKSIGWGGLEEKVNQRSREEVVSYDVSANIELSKFLPEKSGVKIPFYIQQSTTIKSPEYDPYDLDIRLKDKLRATADPIARDSIRIQAQDVTTNRGYNFTNVRKERTKKGVPLPWDISNFSLTYAFNNQRKHNPFIVNDDQKQYKGAIDYNYSTGLKPFTPFKKLIKKDKYLKFITDFNFNPLPNTYGFNTNMERLFNTTTYRFVDETDLSLNTFYNKRFTWDRNYDLGWDISKSLKFNYDANARSIIDEPREVDNNNKRISNEFRRDSIMTNLRNLGRQKNFDQNVSVNYTLPFKSIPMMDWVTMKASYTGGYTWSAASLKLTHLGNTIQNNSTRQINGDLNFEGLYNKSKYLKKINTPSKEKGKGKGKNKTGGDLGPDGKGREMGGDDGSGSDLGPGGRDRGAPGSGRDPGGRKDPANPLDPSGKATDPTGKDGKPAVDKDGKPIDPAAAGKDGKKKGSKDSKADKKAKDAKAKDREPSMAERVALRPLMLVRKGRFTYSEKFGTVIPGFTPTTKLMGLSEGFKAPGWDFVAGFQPDDQWLDQAADRNWISTAPELNQESTKTYTQNLDAGLTVEPFKDFRVELNATRQYTRNHSELFKDQNFDPDSVDFQHRSSRDMGSFTTSFFAMNTLFSNDINGLFDRYEGYRRTISERLGVDLGVTDPHEVDPGFKKGYGKIQQEVLIPAFLAAYTDKDPKTSVLDVFKVRPAVNWKLSYNGLSKVGNLDKIFSSIQISHGYKSTLTVNSYNTDMFYDPTITPPVVDTLNFNYIARFEIPQVLISEQMQPLLGVDVKLKNSMTFKLDFKKSRNLAMSFIDYQLAETRTTGYTAGFGYRLKNVNIPILTGKKAKKGSKAKSKKKTTTDPAATDPAAGKGGSSTQGNDMNFKFDFDLKDDITVNHRLDQTEDAVPTRGSRTITISPSVDYALNKRLTMRLFCDYRKTVPKTSASFPITNINAGVTVQFKLN